MRIGAYRVQAVWGHLGLLAFLAVFVVWYVLDARAASPFIENTILIVPASILALILIVTVVPQTISITRADPETEPAGERQSLREFALAHRHELRAGMLMLLLGGYVFSAPFIGFDAATFLFLATSLWVVGERRPLIVLGFALALAAVLIAGMQAALTLDLPTLIL